MSDSYSSTKMMVVGALLLDLQLHACQSPALPLPPAPVGQVQKLDLSDPKFPDYDKSNFITLSVNSSELFLSTNSDRVVRKSLTQPVKTFEYWPDQDSLIMRANGAYLIPPAHEKPISYPAYIDNAHPGAVLFWGSNYKDPPYSQPSYYSDTLWIELDSSQRVYVSSFLTTPPPMFDAGIIAPYSPSSFPSWSGYYNMQLIYAQVFAVSKEDQRQTVSHKLLDSLWQNQDLSKEFTPRSVIQGLALDTEDSLYFSLIDQHSVYRTKFTMLKRIAGQPGQSGYVDGKAEDARFEAPRAIEVDAQGNVYVLEADKSRVRKITPDGTVSTLAGGVEPGYADGKGSQAKFNKPFDLAVSARGDVYVSDTGNNRIRKITPDGTVSTLIGTGEKGVSEGEPLKSNAGYPLGIDISPDGTLYYIAAGSMDSLHYSILNPPKFPGAVLRFKLAD